MKNIVSVLQFGFLENNPACYYLDMELCDLNLESYIFQNVSPEIIASIHDALAVNSQEASNRMVPVWRIILDICNGVRFIHEHQEVHRDLKPKNGTKQTITSNI
jgi:serine/threonine protein kinase